MQAEYRFDHPLNRGFTLIELLVVISIISLLIAVLLPALASARKSGQAISCASSLRQIGIAGFAYTNDYDGYFPKVTNSIGASFGPHPTIKFFDWWVSHFMCYTGHATQSNASASWQKAKDIWDCPTNPSPHCSNGASGNYVVNREIAYNFRADVTNMPNLDRNLGRPTLWNNASDLIYLGDAAQVSGYTTNYNYTEAGYNGRYNVGAWHLDRANIVFLDGHASRQEIPDSTHQLPMTYYPQGLIWLKTWRN